MSMPSLLSQHIVRRPQRIALLQHIAEQGSITRAAKSAGLSYKAAWDAIDELNNLAQKPLVERSVGGKGGGGAKLSSEGGFSGSKSRISWRMGRKPAPEQLHAGRLFRIKFKLFDKRCGFYHLLAFKPRS